MIGDDDDDDDDEKSVGQRKRLHKKIIYYPKLY